MRAAIAPAMLLACAACTGEDVVARLVGSEGAPRDGGTGGTGGDTGGGTNDGGTCTASIAASALRFALCTCEDYINTQRLSADVFDSRDGPYRSGGTGGGGSVGVSGRIDTSATMTVGGSLVVAGAAGIHTGAGADLSIGQDLEVQGPLLVQGSVDVGGECRVGGRIMAENLRVRGALVVEPNADIQVSGTRMSASTSQTSIQIAAPCHCAPQDLFDAAAYVAQHRTMNDDASLGFAPDALAAYQGPRTLVLPAGRIYLSKLAGQGDLTLALSGRTAVYLDGDLTPGAGLVVDAGAQGELDFFVAGNVTAPGPLVLGSAATAGRVRLYVGGTGTVQLVQGGTFGGIAYAPKAELISMGPVEAFGPLFVRRIGGAGVFTLHADRGVEAGGPVCPF